MSRRGGGGASSRLLAFFVFRRFVVQVHSAPAYTHSFTSRLFWPPSPPPSSSFFSSLLQNYFWLSRAYTNDLTSTNDHMDLDVHEDATLVDNMAEVVVMDFDNMARASDRDPVLVALLTEWGKKKGAAAQRLNASGVEVPNRDTHELRIARLKQRRARRRQQSVDAGADKDVEDARSKLAAAVGGARDDFAVTLAGEEKKKKKKASGGRTMTEKEERGWGATDPLLTSTESKSNGNPKDTSYLRFGIRYHTPKDAPLRLNFRAQEDLSRERRNAHKERADRLQQIILEQEKQEEQDELQEMQVAAAAEQDAATADAGESKGESEVASAAGAAGAAGAASAAGKLTMAGVAGVLIARARLTGAPLRGRAKRRARKQQFLPPSRYKAPQQSTTHAYSPLFNKDEFRLRRRDKKIRDTAKYHGQYGHAALIIQRVYR